jgi:predicted ribonuclease YlaK
LNDGVDVVSNRIRIRSIATEPCVDEVLPWLDPTSPDDRILASCVETMRVHPRSKVALVTGDINLQNKAEFARIPFLEPPLMKKKGG